MGRTWALLMFGLVGCGSSGSSDGGGGSSGEGGGTASAYPTVHWPSIHRDSRNSDFVDIDGARDLEPAFSADAGLVVAVMTVGPTGNLYATGGGGNCNLYAFDHQTGEMRWCTGEIGGGAISSSALSDTDGNLYVADEENMYSFNVIGVSRWKAPIDSAPLSSLFTPEGNLLFISNAGVVRVLDRATGEALIEPLELLPGYESMGLSGCLAGGSEDNCVVANTPAMNPETGALFLTFNRPGQMLGSILALQYTPGDPPTLDPNPLWEAQILVGGGGATPTLSVDGSRLYVTDASNDLYSVDTATGDVVWSVDIGFAPLGSPSVSPSGRIIPGPLGRLVAVQDRGDRGEILWDREDLPAVGVVAQAREVGYAYTLGTPGSIVAFDVETGDTLDEEPGNQNASIGVTLDSEGRVFTTSFNGGISAYAPAR